MAKGGWHLKKAMEENHILYVQWVIQHCFPKMYPDHHRSWNWDKEWTWTTLNFEKVNQQIIFLLLNIIIVKLVTSLLLTKGMAQFLEVLNIPCGI